MDHTPKRVILFNKKSDKASIDLPEKGKKKEVAIAKKPQEVAKQQEKTKPVDFIQWLKAHDLIKMRPLCKKAGIDPSTFHRWVNVTKDIPDEVMQKLTPILKDYGFESGL